MSKIAATTKGAASTFTSDTTVLTGTAQAGALNSITLAVGSNTTADFYATPTGNVVLITGGTGAGQTANVLTSRVNLFSYSKALDNAYWYKEAGILPFGSGSVANAIAGPEGTIDADLIVETTTASTSHAILSTNITTVIGNIYSMTRYIHSYSANRNLDLQMKSTQFGVTQVARFNPDTGVVISSSGGGSATITNVGNGWWKCTLTSIPATAAVSAAFNCYLYTTTDIYTGDGVSGLYLSDAQLEVGPVGTTIIHTEANPGVGVAITAPWVTLLDNTSVYAINNRVFQTVGNWPTVKHSTAVGETATVNVGFQLLVAGSFNNGGSIINNGDVAIL
jgi:hypothetical protein